MGSEIKDYFEDNGYVVLSNAITQDRANFLTQHMFSLHDSNKLVRDDQCPKSDAVYGDAHMEELLHEFAVPIGNQIGRRLAPTYAYARIYRPGEVLKKHKDRPACEISATMTLGFDGKSVYPIFFSNGEKHQVPVQLDVGELAVYKGCELLHWRNEFKGKWHVQVFLHYVDLDGPYADEAGDSRTRGKRPTPNVVHHQEQQQLDETPKITEKKVKVSRPHYDSVYIPSSDDTLPGYIGINSKHMPELMFTKEECDRIVNLTKDLYHSDATVGGDHKGKFEQEIRKANIFVLENDEENRWIFEKLCKIISVLNQEHYDYEISGIVHGLQLIHYTSDDEVKGHYDWHVDAGRGPVATRKISVTVQLTDPNEYEGCDLVVNDHGNIFEATREQGSINSFPSYMPHKVTNITKGERYALVIWVHGSRRFR